MINDSYYTNQKLNNQDNISTQKDKQNQDIVLRRQNLEQLIQIKRERIGVFQSKLDKIWKEKRLKIEDSKDKIKRLETKLESLDDQESIDQMMEMYCQQLKQYYQEQIERLKILQKIVRVDYKQNRKEIRVNNQQLLIVKTERLNRVKLFKDNYENLRKFMENKYDEIDLKQEDFKQFYKKYSSGFMEVYQRIRQKIGQELEHNDDSQMNLEQLKLNQQLLELEDQFEIGKSQSLLSSSEYDDEPLILPIELQELLQQALECPLEQNSQVRLKEFIQCLNIDHCLYLQISNLVQMHLKIFEQEYKIDQMRLNNKYNGIIEKEKKLQEKKEKLKVNIEQFDKQIHEIQGLQSNVEQQMDIDQLKKQMQEEIVKQMIIRKNELEWDKQEYKDQEEKAIQQEITEMELEIQEYREKLSNLSNCKKKIVVNTIQQQRMSFFNTHNGMNTVESMSERLGKSELMGV